MKLKGELCPKRWLDEEANKFSRGKNPWTDIYTAELTNELSEILSLELEKHRHQLRLRLAATTEYLFDLFGFVGGAAAPSKKRDWAERVVMLGKRLNRELIASNDFHSAILHRKSKNEGFRIYPSSETTKRVAKAEREVAKLVEFLETPTLDDDKGSYPTHHAQYLQLVVDGMAEVFVSFRGGENVKRSVEETGVYGEFPEFVRASANPALFAYYDGYKDNTELSKNLDRQIQKSVEKASKINTEQNT